MPREPRRWFDPLGVLYIENIAAFAWLIVLIVVTVQVVIRPREHSVYPIFAHAGESWVRGESVYGDKRFTHHLEYYRYSPTAAAFFAPFSALSLRAGGLIWRLGSAAVFLGGMAWWFHTVLPVGLTRKHLGWLLLLTIPLCATSIGNSQTNTLMLGLLMISGAAATKGRWTLAAAAVVAASAFKVYPLAVGLLMAVAFPRKMSFRLAAVVIAAAVLPFLTQRPSYVASQYSEWVYYLRTDVRHHVSIENVYRDIRFLFRVWDIRIDDATYAAIQLTGAAAAAGACLAATLRDLPVRRQMEVALALGTTWMTLFGPATEPCTYMLIAPSLIAGLIEAIVARRWSAIFLLGSSFALFVADPLSVSIPNSGAFRHSGVLPIAGLLGLAGLIRLALLPNPLVAPVVLPDAPHSGMSPIEFQRMQPAARLGRSSASTATARTSA